ncbi:DUF6519 domain-containing protein [Kribbella sp. CA-253562]|uniref:DUF6519 domain-containing protein n=1 Tax=Kribbella sp. CA-253562 TaxID=3239942 RepID=UPI003D8F882B
MAIISPNKFDPLLGYVNVRLQQGVPIVDADVNELDDIRKFELRAFLKWFVGDGVPEGNDGFRIARHDAAPANDFLITLGVTPPTAGTTSTDTALRNVGRIIVDGLDVIIEQTVPFTAQPLHEDQPGADALAARLGVPKVAKLKPPTAGGAVFAYLDLWERLVTADEDADLVHTGLGVETCARMRREWVVRVGDKVPVPGKPGFLAGHAYTPLALIRRRQNDPAVQDGDIVDQRARRLLVPPATLVEDVLGVDPVEYRSGSWRPPISVREAVNALLRGELPSTPDRPLHTSASTDSIRRGFVLDTTGGLVATLQSDRVLSVEQVFASRLDLADIHTGFGTPPLQVTSGADAHVEPHLAVLPGGDLLLAYQHKKGTPSNIQMKRARLDDLDTAPEIDVATDAAVAESSPFVTVTDPLATIFFHRAGTNRWSYRRWRIATSAFVDATPIQLSTAPATAPDFHAAADPSGKVWAAFRSQAGLTALSFDPASGTVAQEFTLANPPGGGSDEGPFVLPVNSGGLAVWVFWRHTGAGGRLFARFFASGAWQERQEVPNTGDKDHQPCAIADADGAIWLFWSRGDLGSRNLFAMRRDPVNGTWAEPRQLTTATGDENAPHVLYAPDGSIWILWLSGRDGNVNVYYKRLVTAI